MQYPPQQPPANQPYYPPSEIYQYDQLQQFAPAQEVTQPPVQRQDIVIYSNRTQTIMRTIIGMICLIFLVVTFAAFLILGFTTGGSFQASDLAALLMFVAAIALVGWLTWRMVSQLLLSRKPVLIIHREGITIGKLPALSDASISWAEIEAIYAYRYIIYKYLCIRPKNTEQFLSRFGKLKQFNMRINSMTGAPLNVPQVFLDRPVEEILQQLYYMYSSELNYYHVQLRS
jgi:hypothetical protein